MRRHGRRASRGIISRVARDAFTPARKYATCRASLFSLLFPRMLFFAAERRSKRCRGEVDHRSACGRETTFRNPMEKRWVFPIRKFNPSDSHLWRVNKRATHPSNHGFEIRAGSSNFHSTNIHSLRTRRLFTARLVYRSSNNARVICPPSSAFCSTAVSTAIVLIDCKPPPLHRSKTSSFAKLSRVAILHSTPDQSHRTVLLRLDNLPAINRVLPITRATDRN